MKWTNLYWGLIAILALTGRGFGQTEPSRYPGESRAILTGDGRDDDDDDDEEDEAEDGVAGAPAAGNPVPLNRQMHPLGFSVAVPPGWRIHAPKLESVTLISGDGASVALIRGIAGAIEPARWLTNQVLEGEPIARNWRPLAVDEPSRGLTRAAFELVGSDGTRRLANGFAVAGLGGASAMIAAAPPDRFPRELPRLSEILHSFRIEERPARTVPAATNSGPAIPFVTWRDPREGAFTVDTPQGWSVEGGVFRPDLFGTRSGVTMTAPQGRHVVWLHDPSLPRLFVHVSSSLRGLGPIQPNYVNYQDAPTFAAGYIRHRFGEAWVERVTPLPAVVQRLDSLGRTLGKASEVNTAASVDFRLADGRFGMVNVAVSYLPNGFDDGGSWNVAELCGFVSAPEETAVGSTVLQRALSTFAVDARWFAGELQGNRAAGEALTRHREEVAAIYSQITEDRHASQTRMAEQRGQLLAGTTRVLDPETGERFETQAGRRYYFRHVAAEPAAGRPVAVGSDLDDNPSPGDFRRLLEIQVDGTAR